MNLPIAERIRTLRRQPEYFRVVQGLRDYSIILYSEQFLELGKGSFGKCYLGKIVKNTQEDNLEKYDFNQLIRNDELIAVKVFSKANHKNTPEQYRAEVKNLYELSRDPKVDNSNIVKIIFPQGIESERNYYLVTEYCNNCTLFDLIDTRRQSNRKFTLWQFIQLSLDLISGYRAMRSKGIMHNDLKPQNIFIKNKIFKLGDFGLAVKLSSAEEIPCGTILYAAAEKLHARAIRTDIDHKADIFSLGLILYEVLYGCHPYYVQKEYEQFKRKEYERMVQGKTHLKFSDRQLKRIIYLEYLKAQKYTKGKLQLTFDSNFTGLVQELQAMVEKMCAFDKNKRLSLEQVLNRMRELNLENYVKRTDLFHDLKELSQSELRFQLANMSKYAVSTVQLNSVRHSLQMMQTQPTILHKVRTMKHRLFVIFELFRLFAFIKGEVEQDLRRNAQSPTIATLIKRFPPFSQLMANYLYSTNQRELKLTSRQMLEMSEEEQHAAELENIRKDLTQLKQNDEELYKETSNEEEEEEGAHANALKEFIKQRLRNELITNENQNDVIAWVLLYDLILLEQTHRNAENKEEMERELQRIENNFAIFKLEVPTKKEQEMGKKILRENEEHFVYFVSIDTE